MRLGRLAVYLLLSGLITLSFVLDVDHPASRQGLFWLLLAILLAGLWSSFPAYGSRLLQQATAVVTLVVVANLFMEPLADLAVGTPLMHGPVNVSLKVRPTAGIFPGINGVQTVTTDGRGFRTNRPVDYANKPPGVLRVVAIGASTTEDGYLGDDRTWTNLTAKRLEKAMGRRVEMINTGVSGVRLKQNYATFLDSASYAPDVAIFMLGVNDWNWQIRRDARPALLKALDFLAPFSITESVLFRTARMLRNAPAQVKPPPEIIENDADVYLARADSTRRRPVLPLHIDAVSNDYADGLAKISAECKARRIVCLYVDQANAYDPRIEERLRSLLWMTPPDASFTLSLDDMRRVAGTYNRWLSSAAERDRIPFCGVAGVMPPTTEVFFDDCHFNERGAHRIAALVADCLLQRLR